MKNLRFIRPLCIAASIVFSACSSHGSGIVPSSPASPGQGSHFGAAAKLSIVVPRPSARSSARRRPLYVSPSSAQLGVAVNGGTAVTYGLTPSTPGCAVQLQNLTCVFSIAAPAGNDSFALTLSDGTGNVLSKNVVSANLQAGAATPVNVTLAAVPASVAIVPGPNATIEGSASPAYHIPGLFAQPVELEALDADGNVIVGPGAPTFSTPSVSGSNVAIVSAGGNDPNAYVLKTTGGAGGETVSIAASAQGVPLNDGTTSSPVTGSQGFTYTPAIAAVAGRSVNAFSVETGNQIAQLPLCAGLCALIIGTSVATDSKGNIYAAVTSIAGLSQSRTVAVFATGSQVQTAQLGSSNGVTGAIALAVDRNDMLYVANAGTGFGFHHTQPSITEYAAGATTPTHQISGGLTGISSPVGIAADSSGNVYEADGDGFINVYGAGNQTTPAQTLSDPQLATPAAIAVDASGGIYVSDSTNGYIVYFAPGSAAVTSTLSDGSFGGDPGSLTFDPNGNLWASVASSSIEELAAGSLPASVTIARTIAGSGSLAWIP